MEKLAGSSFVIVVLFLSSVRAQNVYELQFQRATETKTTNNNKLYVEIQDHGSTVSVSEMEKKKRKTSQSPSDEGRAGRF